MAAFSLSEIIKATGGILSGTADKDKRVTGISTDTRTLKEGEVFFALKGENHDAHDHLEEAVLRGASLLIVRGEDSSVTRPPAGQKSPPHILKVKDTLAAYQDLAAYYMRKLDPLVIAVTGSVGKTTLKDMIACILEGLIKTYYTKGNINNQVGLPRTILEAGEDDRVLVLEMGLAIAGDIERLSDIARPDIAAITNVGLSHRENFDSDDGILKAKFEITTYMDERNALIIDAGGNEDVRKYAEKDRQEKGYRLLSVAAEGTAAVAGAEYVVSPVRISETDTGASDFEICDRKTGEKVSFEIPLPGAFAGISAAQAAAASIYACEKLGVTLSLKDAAQALKNLSRTPHRLEPVFCKGILVIDDTYNASPASAKAGLDYMKNVPAKKRIAVLGDMNELGPMSGDVHRDVGKAAACAGADIVYAYGKKAKQIAEGAGKDKSLWFDENEKEKLIAGLKKELQKGDVVYIKGSRGMKMEDVVTALTEENDGES